MSENLIDLEWLDIFHEPMSYEEVRSFIFQKNCEVPNNERRWRLPSPHEIRIIIHNHLPGVDLKKTKYMCRSSRSDGKIAVVDSEGKLTVVDHQSRLHFCLVR